MKFSFITCTYNRDKYLGRTIESVCEQTFDPDNYEIIIIDNNSTDNTSKVCEEFQRKYTDKKILYFKELNQGLSSALNRGIKEAKGEFLVFVDDDETITKEHLQRLDNYLKEYPDAVLAASKVIPQYEKQQPKWMSKFTARLIGGYFNPGDQVKKLNKTSYPGTGHTIIKKELYHKYGYYNTELGRTGNSLLGAEDKDMFFRLIKNNIECYYFPDIPIYHHIPEYKLTDEFFNKLTYSIGKSEYIRTRSISPKTYRKRLFDELIKWGASFVLWAFYLLTFSPSKGYKLLQFRWNVSKGLLGY